MKKLNYVPRNELFILHSPLILHCFNYLKVENTEQLEDERDSSGRSGNSLSSPEGLDSCITERSPVWHLQNPVLDGASWNPKVIVKNSPLFQLLMSEGVNKL